MTQRTKSALQTEIAADSPDNTTGAITPALLRTMLNDIVDSYADFSSVGAMQVKITGVNFNSANTDNQITIPTLPSGYTRYQIEGCRISGASASISSATCGLFTTTGGGGTAIVTSATACTVTTASESTNANMQSLTINNSTTMSFTNSTLQFRVQTAQGSPATANVTLSIRPIS